MLPGEDGSVGDYLCQDAAHRPDVDGLGVALGIQHDFWSPLPAIGHITCQELYDFWSPLPAIGHIPCQELYVVSSVQSLSSVWLFTISWTTAYQAFLSITNSWSLLKLMSIESVMPSKHLIFCHPLLLLPSILPCIWVFSSESVPHIRWPKVLEFQLQHQSFQWIFRDDFL